MRAMGPPWGWVQCGHGTTLGVGPIWNMGPSSGWDQPGIRPRCFSALVLGLPWAGATLDVGQLWDHPEHSPKA